MIIEKYVRDGQVAVLYSPDYGAGWSSWVDEDAREWRLFDKGLVELVLDGASSDRIEKYVRHSFGGGEYAGGYLGGASGIAVKWVPIGERFRIHEYDGSESVILLENDEAWTA